MEPPDHSNNRRELKTRRRAWPGALARVLARAGITPNMISVMSVAFALIAPFAYCWVGTGGGWNPSVLLVLAAAGIQLRLLCNLLDGLLAIEGGLKTGTGDLFNEIPDRVADAVILIGAGFAVSGLPWGPTLGWIAALLAVLTAYIRLLGGSLGFRQDFVGPMAKQHRMFTLTAGSLVAAIEVAVRGSVWSVYLALWIIIIGSTVTLIRRTRRIARAMEAR